MKLTAELSLYPLADDYIPVIKAFIEQLNADTDITITTNAMSHPALGRLQRGTGTDWACTGAFSRTIWPPGACLQANSRRAGYRSVNYAQFCDSLFQALSAMSALEIIGVIAGIVYIVGAAKEQLWCWYAAFIGTAAFLVLFWQVKLLMESALQVYYLAMAVYGWHTWQQGTSKTQNLPIKSWPLSHHLLACIAIACASLISGYLLSQYTEAALPYLDAVTTWGSIFTTWMVAQKILQNWLYWIVIDALSIVLYLDRELYLTAALFVLYVLIAGFGYYTWRHHYRAQTA